jgi:5-methylcytosine-specific restriction endonuclease McrA
MIGLSGRPELAQRCQLRRDRAKAAALAGLGRLPCKAASLDHIKPRSKGYSLDGNLALVCCHCNHDKGSLSLGQWLTRLSRAGDPRADHVAAFIERGPATSVSGRKGPSLWRGC